MEALLFLTVRKTKNGLVQLLKPKYLISLALYIVAIIFSLWYKNESIYFEISKELYLIICWFLYGLASTAMMINITISGVIKFERSDIDYLVSSPINQNQIFLYGFYQKYRKTIGILILISIFSFISLKDVTTIELGVYLKTILILLWLLFAVFFISIQILVDIKRHNKSKIILWVLMIIYAIVTLVIPLVNLLIPLDFYSWKVYIPLIGWAISLLENILSLKAINHIITYAVIVSSCLVGIYLLNKQDFSCFYNNFLEPEENFQRKIFNNRKSKKVFGWGSTAMIGKNHIESLRKDKIPYLDIGMVFFSIFILVLGIGLTQTYDSQGVLLSPILVLLVSTLMLALFGVLGYSSDSIKIEVKNVYTHLIPVSAYKKIISITIIPITRHFMLAVTSIFILSIVSEASFLLSLNINVFYLSVTFLLMAVNVLFIRFFGSDIDETFGLWMYLKYVIGLIAMLPGIIVLIVTLNLLDGYFYPFFMASLINFCIYLIICYLCKPLVN